MVWLCVCVASKLYQVLRTEDANTVFNCSLQKLLILSLLFITGFWIPEENFQSSLGTDNHNPREKS